MKSGLYLVHCGLVALVFTVVACTDKKSEKETDSENVVTALPMPAPTTEEGDMADEPAAGTSPEEDPVQAEVENRCEEQWAKAAAVVEKLVQKPDKNLFKELIDNIPAKEEPVASCDNQDVVMQALDQNMPKLRKAAPSVFEFTVLMARLQYVADGAVAEGICEEGPVSLKQSPKDFLRALHQERGKMQEMDCMVTSPFEFVDASPAERRQGIQKRIDLLKTVKDKDLAPTRDELIGVLVGSQNSYQ